MRSGGNRGMYLFLPLQPRAIKPKTLAKTCYLYSRVFGPTGHGDRLEAYPTLLPGVSSDDSSAPESTFSYPPRRGDGVV